jgi:uncharacterized lipoprotein
MISSSRLVLRITVGLLALLVGGCAFTPQKVSFAPNVLVAPSDRGAGVSVAVKVVDERASLAIGRRGTAYGDAAAITSDQNVAAVIEAELIKGLQKKGFTVVGAGAAAPATLSAELRLLDYSTSTGMWTGGIHLRTTIKARAARGESVYEQTYRAEREERVMVVPTAEKNQEWINDSLADAIGQILSDDALLKSLAGR